MIWFNLKKLENRIVEDNFSDKEGFNYFLAFSILGVSATCVSSSENFVTVIELVAGVIITIWGSYLIFNTNESGDGKDFFKRYFALSWVIGFRLFVFALIAIISLIILCYSTISPEHGDTNFIAEDFASMIIASLFLLIYFLLLNNSFRRVAMK